MVLFIALLHGLFVFVIGAWTKSRIALLVAAIIAGTVGVMTGASIFSVADILAVALGFWMGLGIIKSHEAQLRREDAATRQRYEEQHAEEERARKAAARQRTRTMEPLRTHYDNLHVTRDASVEVIRAAYRTQVNKYHPDKYTGSKREAERITKILNEAYAILTDPDRRRAHDEWIDEQHWAPEVSADALHSRESSPARRQQNSPQAPQAPPSSLAPLGAIGVLAVVVFGGAYFFWEPEKPQPRPVTPPTLASPVQTTPAPDRAPPAEGNADKRISSMLAETRRPPEVKLSRTPDPQPVVTVEPPPQKVVIAPPTAAPIAPPVPCRIFPGASARTSCPQASAQELHRLYRVMVQRRRESGDTGYWEARSQEVFDSTANCASEDCVRGILYRALDEVASAPSGDHSPG